LRLLPRQAQFIRDRAKIILSKSVRARHQRNMGIPEFFRVLDGFHQFGGAPRNVAVANRAMAKHVAQTIAELAANLHDALVGRAAMRAVVAAIFHKRDRSVGWAENMIPPIVDRIIETLVRFIQR
jgi:hypothetical protein